jgi:hypothetical protein
VVPKRRDRLSVSKRGTQKFDEQRFYLKKLNDAEVKEQTVQVKLPSKKFAVSENLDDNVDTITPWENIRENVTISAKKKENSLGQYKSKCSKA